MQLFHVWVFGRLQSSVSCTLTFMMLHGSDWRGKRKAHALAKVKGYMTAANHISTPRFFRIDNDGGFLSQEFIDFRDDVRFRREYTAPAR